MSGARAAAGRTVWAELALALCLAAILVAGARFWVNAHAPFPWMNHDVSFLTYAGMELLDGARLYVDFEEVNPPGSHYLQAGLLALADGLGLPVFFVYHGFVLALGLAGLLLVRAGYDRAEDASALALVALAYTVVVLRGNFANNIIIAPDLPYDFGQREHVFAILFVPYVLWRICGGRVWPAIYPYLALLGFVAMFKPFWPPLVALVELYAWPRQPRRRLALWSALGAGMLTPYVLLLADSGASFRAFFGRVVPWVLGGGYAQYDTAYGDFARTPLHLMMAGGTALFAACWAVCLARGLVDRRTLALLAVVVLAGYATLVVQRKFWSYHGMPFFGVLCVFTALLLARVLGGLPRGRPRVAALALAGAALAALVGGSLWSLERMLDLCPPKGREVVPLLRDERKVMFFSTSVDYAYAPLHTRVATVGPWRAHSRLADLLAIDDVSRRRAELDAYAERVRRQIERERPDLLLFEPSAQALPAGRTLEGVLLLHGAIPREQYVRRAGADVARGDPALLGWVVYRRLSAG